MGYFRNRMWNNCFTPRLQILTKTLECPFFLNTASPRKFQISGYEVLCLQEVRVGQCFCHYLRGNLIITFAYLVKLSSQQHNKLPQLSWLTDSFIYKSITQITAGGINLKTQHSLNLPLQVINSRSRTVESPHVEKHDI